MLLPAGCRLGDYEIVELLGRGGMGEVYRARDARLQRDVALKIVHPELAGDDHLARFRREARMLAGLSHANIANVHELEEAAGTTFIVMELVSGQTLGERIAAAPMPVAEVLRVAQQIVAALESIHDQGVVHRDLKPANIKITDDGVVKVLDFGLAKPVLAGVAASAATQTVEGTGRGVVVGTAAYMSPEQARGFDVDRRSDVWSFGCVLFEMLTSRPAFPGDTTADTIAKVIDGEPAWDALPTTTPPSVVRLLRRCLRADPRQRLRHIGDAWFELEEANDPVGAVTVEAPRRRAWSPVAVAAALLASGLMAAAGAFLMRAYTAPAIAAHVLIPLPSNTQLGGLDFPSIAVAPDGSHVAFVASRGGGQTQLFLRPLNAADASPLPGTTNAIAPFFSPDGEWVAFFADGQLKKVPVAGGDPVAVSEAPVGLGGAWGPDDVIVFASTTGAGLSRVPAQGGTPERITTVEVSRGEFSHRWPEWLPDGRTVLYTVGTVGSWNDAQIVAQDLGTGERSVVVRGGTNPRYAASGHLLYAHDGRIMRVPFDAARRAVTGSAVAVVDNVRQSVDGAAQFALSPAGVAVFAGGGFATDQRRLVGVARDGTLTPFAAPPGRYASPRVSPDGQRVLLTGETSAPDLWIYDIPSGSLTQLTFDANAAFPAWAPDGRRAAFSSTRSGALNVYTMDVERPGSADRLAPSDNMQIAGAWSAGADGTLAYVERQPTTGRDILLLGRGGARAPRAFLASSADESSPRFSPAGDALAYVSNESGRNEVYVRPVSGSEGGTRVSTRGGSEPVWARSGLELFYREGDRLIGVRLSERAGEFRAAATEVLFERDLIRGTVDAANYDVTADGRFVMLQRQGANEAVTSLQVLLNWDPAAASSGR